MIFSTRIVSLVPVRQDNNKNINIPPNSKILFFIHFIFPINFTRIIGSTILKRQLNYDFNCLVAHLKQTPNSTLFRISTNSQFQRSTFCITIDSNSFIKIFRILCLISYFNTSTILG